jgi:molybdopterin-binding protein
VIHVQGLKVKLGSFMLQDIDLLVKDGEYFIILGPTGAGKTVVLEAIAGLHPIVAGTISVNGKDVTHEKPEKRGIAIVYQDQMLFPHLSVERNISFGLKALKFPKEEIKPRITSIAELLGITHLLHRDTTTLSGGEKQKTALARALVAKPAVLLLDEPLSALDPETRERMQRELASIHRQLQVTMVHVTHDFEEAVGLGDRVAVLNDGRIVQLGTPQDVLRRPKSEFVAMFALSRNVFIGEATDAQDGRALIDVGQAKLEAVTSARGRVHASLRPEDISISMEPLSSTARNSFCGTIVEIIDRGTLVLVTVNVPPEFSCLVTSKSFSELNLRKGVRVWISFKASAINVF